MNWSGLDMLPYPQTNHMGLQNGPRDRIQLFASVQG